MKAQTFFAFALVAHVLILLLGHVLANTYLNRIDKESSDDRESSPTPLHADHGYHHQPNSIPSETLTAFPDFGRPSPLSESQVGDPRNREDWSETARRLV